eukprot:1150138-Pelagomonas_calceolata.AAC.3
MDLTTRCVIEESASSWTCLALGCNWALNFLIMPGWDKGCTCLLKLPVGRKEHPCVQVFGDVHQQTHQLV